MSRKGTLVIWTVVVMSASFSRSYGSCGKHHL